MQQYTQFIIGGLFMVVSILLFALQFKHKGIIKVTKWFIGNKSNPRSYFFLNIFILVILMIGILITRNEIDSNTSQHKDSTAIVDSTKSDTEIIVDGVVYGLEILEEQLQERRKIDRELLANREERLVLQIGNIIDNKDLVFKKYLHLKKIKDIDISNIYLFKVKRNMFFFYYDDPSNKGTTRKQLHEIKESADFIGFRVNIIDLHSYCKAIESVVNIIPLIHKDYDFEIPKCECKK